MNATIASPKHADYQPTDRQSFSALRALNEDTIQAASGFKMHPHDNLEILMMPLQGTIAHEDSLGNLDRISTGEVMLMSAGKGIQHSQMNASQQSIDHHLQIWLLPRRRDTTPYIAKQRFLDSGRANRWQLIASPDGNEDSLQVDQDARVWRTRMTATKLSYRPHADDRAFYLHVISGRAHAQLAGFDERTLMHSGDALAMTEACELNLVPVGAEAVELLLIDLPSPRSTRGLQSA
jgi:quercetin 2,3-dioxygenase